MIFSTTVRRFPGLLLAGLFTAGLTSTVAADDWRVDVRGRDHDLGETPVLVEVNARIPQGPCLLKPRGQGQSLRGNVFADAGKTYLGVVLERVPARSTTVYSLTPDASSERSAGIEIRKAGPNLEILVGGKPWTTYLSADGPKPYFFPVIGPTGDSFTRAYPMKDVEGEDRDHPHQRSFWFTHGNVNGYDFWASDPINKPNPKFGSIKETGRPTVASGPGVGVLHTTDDWLGPDGKKVCEDDRVIRFYETAKSRIFDVDVTIKATDGPVTFGDTKEGMFGFRIASSMDVKRKQGGKITNAEGITDIAAWGKASPWVDYVGPVAGKTVGIAILNHPSSFRFPTTWHVRDYGLFAANPFGWHDFGRKESGEHILEKGQAIAFHYRVIMHTGDTASSHIDAAFRAYAEPPQIEVQAD